MKFIKFKKLTAVLLLTAFPCSCLASDVHTAADNLQKSLNCTVSEKKDAPTTTEEAAITEPEVHVKENTHSERVLSKTIIPTYSANLADENSFFSLVFRLRYIKRWLLYQNHEKEDLAFHSFGVGVIAHALAVIKNKKFGGNINAERAALLGIYHDVPEVITGDMPSPIKYHNPMLKSLYDKVEDQAIDEMMGLLPAEFAQDYKCLLKHTEEEAEIWDIVKSADIISAILKCLGEQTLGNHDLDRALVRETSQLVARNRPEVNYFMKTFMPAFGFKCPSEKSEQSEKDAPQTTENPKAEVSENDSAVSQK